MKIIFRRQSEVINKVTEQIISQSIIYVDGNVKKGGNLRGIHKKSFCQTLHFNSFQLSRPHFCKILTEGQVLA